VSQVPLLECDDRHVRYDRIGPQDAPHRAVESDHDVLNFEISKGSPARAVKLAQIETVIAEDLQTNDEARRFGLDARLVGKVSSICLSSNASGIHFASDILDRLLRRA
jgi:hypothetical protein